MDIRVEPPRMKVCRVPTKSVYKSARQQAMKSIEDSFKKNAKKIINSNKENVNWKLTIVNKRLTLNSTLP